MFESIIQRLPEEIVREILYFIIPDSRTITFRNSSGNIYELAFIGDNILETVNNWTFSRICKKNEKHRYYLRKNTEEWSCDDCCTYFCNSKFCYGYRTYYHSYESKFVGKNIDNALLALVKIAESRENQGRIKGESGESVELEEWH